MVTYTKGFNIRYIVDLKVKAPTYLDDWEIILIQK